MKMVTLFRFYFFYLLDELCDLLKWCFIYIYIFPFCYSATYLDFGLKIKQMEDDF